MIIEIKNIDPDVTVNYTTLTVPGASIAPGEKKKIYDNIQQMGSPNTIEGIQLCNELRLSIEDNYIILVVNNVELDQIQSIAVLDPVLNLP